MASFTRLAAAFCALLLTGFSSGEQLRELEYRGSWVSASIEIIGAGIILVRTTESVLHATSADVAIPAGTTIKCEIVGARGRRIAGACRSAKFAAGEEWQPLYGWLSEQRGAAGIPDSLHAGDRVGIMLIDRPNLDRLEAGTKGQGRSHSP
ncbi:hypothetical protein [Ferrovibrio sp.]|uniref:hypothetical protein n=1 Tax=Ferrovibrio sp. TaxID=1917215 RepID=UPI00311DED0C